MLKNRSTTMNTGSLGKQTRTLLTACLRAALPTLLLLLLALPSAAQERYTDYLQRQQKGGTVVLHQDAEIEQLVNGNSRRANSTNMSEGATAEEDEPLVAPSGRHTTANGYRVQIISLGSTAKDKATAESLGKKFKVYFPATNVYVSFIAPHYVCRVGDYKTREEATEALAKIRETNQFAAASIVRSKINIYY